MGNVCFQYAATNMDGFRMAIKKIKFHFLTWKKKKGNNSVK